MTSNLNFVKMLNMNLLTYIKRIRKITVTQAAKESRVPRQYLSAIAHGRPAGPRTAKKIELWSGGVISRYQVMFPDDPQFINPTRAALP